MKSVEQLADNRASIRLGAVHAIEALAADWLAIDNHRQRQVCVNLLCSYLGSLDEPRDENSIQSILAEYDDADETKLRAQSKTAAERLWEDRSVRKAIVESLSDMLVADHQANRDPVVVDLRDIAFGNGLELRKARLARLPLGGADLSRLGLDGADLTGANLQGALLNWTHLSDANLTDADLSEAFLSKDTHLDRAILVRADLRRAHLKGAHLDSADLTNGRLDRAQMDEADLKNATLDGARLGRANLSGADLTNASLVRARLTAANLTDAILTNADLTETKLPSTFQPGSLRGAILTRGCRTLDPSTQMVTPDEWRTEARHQFGRQRIPDFTWTPDIVRKP